MFTGLFSRVRPVPPAARSSVPNCGQHAERAHTGGPDTCVPRTQHRARGGRHRAPAPAGTSRSGCPGNRRPASRSRMWTTASAREPSVVTRRSAREITVSTDRESVDSHADNPVGVAAVTHAGARCTYVIDTSVLLSDPWALNRFDEHEVVLPLVVIGELEAKRHHPELGYFARQALRMLDDLRIEHGRLDAPVPVGDRRRHPARRAQPHRLDGAAGRIPQRQQRLPHPGLRAEPGLGTAGRPGHRWSPRTCRCGSRRRRSGWPPTSTGRRTSCRPAGPGWPNSQVARRAGRHPVPRRADRLDEARELPCHTGVSWSPRPVRRWAGSRRASRSGWSAASGRRSACAAGRPSSGSPSTC